MSAYLGFQPTEKPMYYFVSYNNEDAERVGEITRAMSYSGIPLWYDHGIEYGDKWEITITEKIRNSQAVLLFFTKGILAKPHSYVQKEYKIATQFFNKKVYVIFLDPIRNEDVPMEKIAWWIDINERQCIDGNKYDDIPHLIEDFSKSLGIQTHEDKMNKIIETYNALYHEGKLSEAEACLSEYLHGVSLAGKVQLFLHIMEGKLSETKLLSPAKTVKGKLEKPLFNHMKEPEDEFYECKQITVGNDTFTVANAYLFHRGSRGDAHVIWIWRNDELIHVVGGLVEVMDLQVFWDETDDILYITFKSDKEYTDTEQNTWEADLYAGATTVEHPNGEAICSNFAHAMFLKNWK